MAGTMSGYDKVRAVMSRGGGWLNRRQVMERCGLSRCTVGPLLKRLVAEGVLDMRPDPLRARQREYRAAARARGAA